MLARTVQRIKGPFQKPQRPLELQGAHKPYIAADPSGKRWVLKPLQHRGILAEAIGALLGHELGVPIPSFGYFDELEGNIGRGWLSSYIPFANHWTVMQLDDVINHEDLGRMVVLDALIYNEDRNPDNILFGPTDDSDSFYFWAIDTESALVSRPREFASKGLRCPNAYALPNDFSVRSLEESIDTGINLAEGLPEVTLRTIVSAATDAASAQGGDLLLEALKSRCRNAREIVENYTLQLKGR